MQDEDRIIQLKKQILLMSTRAQEGHIASSFSIIDILWVLYNRIIFDADNVALHDFILSKGHASLALYVVLKECGLISQNDIDQFASYNGILGGHPDRNKIKGVIASSGSLGHGLPIGVGLALGHRIRGNTDRKTYVLIGDGELNEGSIWESIELGGHHKLGNLFCIVDYNHSTDRALFLGDLEKKFSSFSWNTISIDGHCHESIETALKSQPQNSRPTAIIANTIKGRGILEMENNPAWHHRFPTKQEEEKMLGELEQRWDKL